MNPLLEEKIRYLNDASDYECWYLVKHSVAFDNLCYLVSFLIEYQSTEQSVNLETYITDKVQKINEQKSLNISTNYRALRVASFFGLIIQRASGYVDASITETFEEITNLCDGNYEDTQAYNHVIQRQIEKMYISSSIDEGSNGVRSEFRLYPVILFYKILLEIGKSTGNYQVTTNEYRYLVATSKKYEDFLDTLLLINLLRKEPETNEQLETFRTKFDNRMIQALKLLDTLEVTNNDVTLKSEYIELVARKVYEFEKNPQVFETDDYLDFLGSARSLFDLSKSSENTENESNLEEIDESERIKGGSNVLLYGVPGAGKSFTIAKEYCDDEERMERLVFHPDYTYSDFVGQILPNVTEGMVRYEFTEGPFTHLLRKSYENPETEYFLVIEEINRGNAPAIFGEVFQLLDRDLNGTSEYAITNYDISRAAYKDENKKVRIPSNMNIVGTMNTSDQNVFTLDTAFQRRWNMRMIENDINKLKPEFANKKLLDTDVTWKNFSTTINSIIMRKNVRMTSSEDKRLGVYFVKPEDLDYVDYETFSSLTKEKRIQAERQNGRFAEKVLKYLWDDAFKFSREDIFETSKYISLEDIVKKFKTSTGNERLDIFKEEIFNAFIAEEGISNDNE